MSTLRIDNFQPSAGGTSFGIEGIAKAYANIDMTTPALRSSENVSSITDNGVGLYDVNLTSAMSGAEYPVTGGAQAAPGGDFVFLALHTNSAAAAERAPTASRFSLYTHGRTTGAHDVPRVTAATHGDLA